MPNAYRQLPVTDDHLRHSVVCVRKPVEGRWVCGVLFGLAFGHVVAALTSSRYPALVTAVARRWLAIPTINFYGDFKLRDVVDSGAPRPTSSTSSSETPV